MANKLAPALFPSIPALGDFSNDFSGDNLEDLSISTIPKGNSPTKD
jgi:hypothetical protein